MHDLNLGVLSLMFVVICLIVGALVRQFSSKIKLPYTVSLLALGIAAGLIFRSDSVNHALPVLHHSLLELVNIDPHLILFLFLPTLIFESAFAMETHLFRRIFTQIALLAIPGLILATLATSVLAKYAFPFEWTWAFCLMFGALISATDPVAVVALLKEVSSRKRLETLIEGESLINDGTAIVLFTLFYGLVIAGASGEFNLLETTFQFTWVVSIGLAVGVALAGISLFWISRIFNDSLIEISITIAFAYLVFYLAEFSLHVSGVVAIVALGVMFASIGRTKFSPEVGNFLHHFWEMMAYVANTLIFILVGLIIAVRIRLDEPSWWLALFILYVGITLIRAGSITLFMPILKRIGIGITREKAVVLWWGGLRGAVSLALALSIAQDTLIPRELGDQVLFLTAGIVVLTLMVNGATMEMLLNKLGMNQLPAGKQLTVDKANAVVFQQLETMLPDMQKNQFMKHANWQQVSVNLALDDLKKAQHKLSQNNEAETEDINVSFRRRILETERKFYWTQFQRGALLGLAAAKLVQAVEKSLDGEPQISPRTGLDKYWQAPPLLKALGHHRWSSKLSMSWSFERLALGYEIARGFILAQEEILKFVDQLAPDQQQADALKADIEHNKKAVYGHIDKLKERFPDLVYRLDTHTASLLLLNKQRSIVKGLVDEAVLAQSEASKMIKAVEARMVALKNMPNIDTNEDFSAQLQLTPWAKDLAIPTLSALSKICQRQIFYDNEIIVAHQAKAANIGIICRGTVLLENNEAQLRVGDTFGFNAFITGHYAQKICAQGPVDILWIKISAFKDVVNNDPDLSIKVADLVKKSEV